MAFDIYAAVTDRIIAQLERGVIPWHKPWTGIQSGAISGTTGKPYSLLNQMLLGKPGEWYTFNQIQKLGGKIRKGEKSSMVVFWKQMPITDTDPATGEKVERMIPMLKYFTCFTSTRPKASRQRSLTPMQSTPPQMMQRMPLLRIISRDPAFSWSTGRETRHFIAPPVIVWFFPSGSSSRTWPSITVPHSMS